MDGEARLRDVLEGQEDTKAFLRAVLEDDPLYRPPQVRRDVVKSPGFGPSSLNSSRRIGARPVVR